MKHPGPGEDFEIDIIVQVRVDFVDTSLLPPVDGECSLQVRKVWGKSQELINNIDSCRKQIGLIMIKPMFCSYLSFVSKTQEALSPRICVASGCAGILWGEQNHHDHHCHNEDFHHQTYCHHHRHHQDQIVCRNCFFR